ncbi:hypothetical protein SLA2020_277610 [Shorea laevis]
MPPLGAGVSAAAIGLARRGGSVLWHGWNLGEDFFQTPTVPYETENGMSIILQWVRWKLGKRGRKGMGEE